MEGDGPVELEVSAWQLEAVVRLTSTGHRRAMV